MVKISEIIASHVAAQEKSGADGADGASQKPLFSFEYFPPKTPAGVQNLYARLARMNTLEPAWFDVTWGAGGSTSELTLELVTTAEAQIGRTTMMHLTCTNMPVSEFERALKVCKEAGLQNILALRGDPPRGEEWKQIEGGFGNAVDLVRYIRKQYGDYFCIAVAGYPEGHETCVSYEEDLQRLKEKVDAGADLVITQLFYDVDIFLKYVADCRAIGVTVPILPGIMPIQTFAGFERMTTLCKTAVPQFIHDELAPISKDEEQVKAYGVKLAAQMCQKIIDAGVSPGLHFYTLNLETSVLRILRELDLIPDDEEAQHRDMPSTFAGKARDGEEVRPIFWSKRPASYLKRTESWDEFPNGRWGDARSPAYGDLTDFHIGANQRIGSELRLDMWGGAELGSVQDVHDVFAEFCKHETKVKLLPWCDAGLDAESDPMRGPLVRINKAGFMTINSQVAVNAKPSADPVYGWGPGDGYVYSKAYLEFFVSPTMWEKLRKICDRPAYKHIQYHAINKAGEEVCSTNSGHVTAVSWGVFPGHEIQQPTVVDHDSFRVWSKEAFALWTSQWGRLYDDGSSSRAIIDSITESYYLVNFVDNDFINGNVFAPLDVAIMEKP